jgi:hypothetical protein
VPNQNWKDLYILINLFPFKSIGLNSERSRQIQPVHTVTNEESTMVREDTYHSAEGVEEAVCQIMHLKLL